MKRVGFLGLLLVALLLRVSIPAGMMLVAGESGPRIVPCPSALPELAVAPPAHHGGPHQPVHDHKAQEPPPCPFGVLLFPALPSAPPLLTAQVLPPEPAPLSPPAERAVPRAPSHLHPPATGPPLRA